MNRIELHGDLARFGTGFEMDVGNPLEAFHALDMQLRGFRKSFVDGNFVAIREDANGKFYCDEELVRLGMYGSTIHFVPYVEGEGRGKGTVKTVLGVAMFVGSFFIPGSTGLFLGMSLKTGTMMLGAALALGGASMLLAPQMKLNNKEGENDQSFLFGGGSNSEGQDFVIPVTYGRDRVRPHIISSQIVTNQIGVGAGQTYDGRQPESDYYYSRYPVYDGYGYEYGDISY